MAEPTNQELLNAIATPRGEVAGLASAEQVDRLERKVDGLNELVAQGFASLGVRETRRAGTGDD